MYDLPVYGSRRTRRRSKSIAILCFICDTGFIYSYYIYLYGMPAYGVGFDATKLSLLATILTKYGVNPYM